MGWREEVPTEALDEHNERGRERIKKMEGNYQRNKDEIFYHESILLNNPVSIADDKYKRLVWDLRKLDKKKINLKYEKK